MILNTLTLHGECMLLTHLKCIVVVCHVSRVLTRLKCVMVDNTLKTYNRRYKLKRLLCEIFHRVIFSTLAEDRSTDQLFSLTFLVKYCQNFLSMKQTPSIPPSSKQSTLPQIALRQFFLFPLANFYLH